MLIGKYMYIVYILLLIQNACLCICLAKYFILLYTL